MVRKGLTTSRVCDVNLTSTQLNKMEPKVTSPIEMIVAANRVPVEPAATETAATKTTPQVGPCPVCHGIAFWRDAYGTVHCRGCQAPTASSMVRQRLIAVDLRSLGRGWVPAEYDPELDCEGCEGDACRYFPEATCPRIDRETIQAMWDRSPVYDERWDKVFP